MHRIVKRKEPGHLKKWKEDFLKKMGREPGYEDLAMSEEYGRLFRKVIMISNILCPGIQIKRVLQRKNAASARMHSWITGI